MKKILILTMVMGIMYSCQSNQTPPKEITSIGNFHKVVVQEVLQTSNYTYLNVKENDSVIWLATPKMEAQNGETYYYQNPMRMENFSSKELNRTFDVVYFLEGLNTEPAPVKHPVVMATQSQTADSVMVQSHDPSQPERSLNEPHAATGKPVTQKEEVKVEPVKGGVTIANLFMKKDSYGGKKVTVKGKVTKVNPGIMNRNWIHIQDGTSFKDKYDLTLTTAADFKVGDVITIEGTVTLNKDFGYGYFYDVIVEDAVQK